MSEKPEAHTLLNGDFVSAIVYERLRAENERLRDELRQSGIDHTRAEVERLKAERDEAVRAEREACARIVKEHLTLARFGERHLGLGDVRITIGDAEKLETAIRARGQEPPR